ncbi:uncharacterized protein DS421_12g369390 [Arachis hypogaea]|nr:uncharacterized protein DS421_12g369390 [Arachis hypogaea]
MKWHFSQFKTKLVSWHRFKTRVKWFRQALKLSPKTEKSSMKTSKNFSTISEKMESIHL